MKSSPAVFLVICVLVLPAWAPVSASDRGIVNTSHSAYAKLRSVDMDDVRVALRMASGVDLVSSSALSQGDVAPLVGGVPLSDGVIDIGDVVVILRKAKGLVTW